MMENSDWPENTAADLFIQQPLNQSQHSAVIEMNECLLQAWQQPQPHLSLLNIGALVWVCVYVRFISLLHLVVHRQPSAFQRLSTSIREGNVERETSTTPSKHHIKTMTGTRQKANTNNNKVIGGKMKSWKRRRVYTETQVEAAAIRVESNQKSQVAGRTGVASWIFSSSPSAHCGRDLISLWWVCCEPQAVYQVRWGGNMMKMWVPEVGLRTDLQTEGETKDLTNLI